MKQYHWEQIKKELGIKKTYIQMQVLSQAW